MKIASQAQARFLGAISRGAKPKSGSGPTPLKARTMLRENRGLKMAALPARAPVRASSRRASRRGGSR